MQTLLKLVIEPYMEPLGDRNSFGFRLGRNCHQAISYLYKKLSVKKKVKIIEKYNHKKKQVVIGSTIIKKSVSSQETQKLRVKNKKLCSISCYILDADIKTCFDKISHEWLLFNVPMPPKYKFLLDKILKSDIIEKSEVLLEKKNSNFGVPQSGVLSNLFINWALDGIENLVFDTVATSIKSDGEKTCYDSGKNKYYKKVAKVKLKYTSWAIRYMDDFIIGVKNKLCLQQVRSQLKFFLKERGLTLSHEKTKIVKWSDNAKINFLSWTCHYLVPKKVSWIIKANNHLAGRLQDWSGLYIYPSKKAVSKLKFRIKQITSHSNSWKAGETVIKTINNLVVDWSSYFSPAPKQGSLRLALDWYIFKRMKRYIFKKYGSSYLENYLKLNQKKNGSRKISVSITNIQNSRAYHLTIQRLYDLNASARWTELVPAQNLLDFSFLNNPAPYLKRVLQIARFRQDLKSKLCQKQKKICFLCNQKLINCNNALYVDNYSHFMNKFNETNYNFLNKIVSFDYHKINDWTKDLEVNYIISMKLADKIKTLNVLLNSINSLRLVHKLCHKNKTFVSEEQQLLEEYRKTQKFLTSVNSKLNILTKNELEKLHIKTVLKLEENKKFEYLHKFKNNTVRKLFKNYIAQIKKS